MLPRFVLVKKLFVVHIVKVKKKNLATATTRVLS